MDTRKLRTVSVPTKALYTSGSESAPMKVRSGDESYIDRIKDVALDSADYDSLGRYGRTIGASRQFKEIVDYFKTPDGETPAGFRLEFQLPEAGLVEANLVRDISYDKNCRKRPTNMLFSVDSANPYEVRHFSDLVANLTCNPGIIYDLFINNPKANVGNKFKTRDEVMQEIGRVLGPGADISVELNNPFETDFNKILEEVEKFKEMLSPYRVVIKVPHTGSVNAENYQELLQGDGLFQRAFDGGKIEDMVRGHNLALQLQERGYRINFTLMFEPHQTNLALQARPYFINAFIRHRMNQGQQLSNLLHQFELTEDPKMLEQLRAFMIKSDFLPPSDENRPLLAVRQEAMDILKYRNVDSEEGADGLDSVRHSLRCLRNSNMPDTRLIICSMEGFFIYKDIDKLLAEPEFIDINDRVVITTDPGYLAKQTTCNQVTSYQRRFMKAAAGQS